MTIQSGADATETTAINFKAITESLLGVAAGTIDLAGTSQQKETIVFSPTMPSDDDTKTYFYTLTVDGVDFKGNGGTAEAVDGVAALDTHLEGATADDGTALTSLYDITNNGTAITLTAKVNGNLVAADYTLTATGGTGSNSVTRGSLTITDGLSKAEDAITAVDTALAAVASERATLGATQAQLESTVRNLANVAENTSAAAGRIMDTDYAAETANLTKAQILQQAATSVLAQANAQPQSVLSLLQ
ncbi:flagellin [Luminiphilus sp.]|nr:flagellin [Luminiphilus sp.]